MAKLLSHKMLVCCGTGGVGKTTIAAALALKGALEGKRVALVTIDPAKRLASSMGLEALGADARSVDKAIEESLGKKPQGSLVALMLDSSHVLERFIRQVGGEETWESFSRSNLYQVISGNFSGIHDYMAMEQLFELHATNQYDLIVLDTPPARHTLDFLDAPERIASFFDDRIFSWFLTDPRSSAFLERLRAQGTKAAMTVLEKLTGEGVIHDFTLLAPHFYKIKNAFVERQSFIQSLLRSQESGALFISSPSDLARGEAEPFLEDARKQEIRVLGVIMNRSLQHLCKASATQAAKELKGESLKAYQELLQLVKNEKANTERVKSLARGCPIVILPEMHEDIHDIHGLYTLSQSLDL